MNLLSVEKVAPNRYELSIEVGKEPFSEAVQRAFLKRSKTLTIKGFRKGKVPRALVEKVYGKEFFYEDAVNELYPAALREATQAAKLKVIDDQQALEMERIDEGGFVFKVTLTTQPEMTLGDYKNLDVTEEEVTVSDEDVDKKLEKVQQRNARLVSAPNRGAQDGDLVVIDFEGFVGGEPFDGGKAENYTLELGSGQFIAGFEPQILGHSVGEAFDINVNFPENYGVPSLAGREAIFKIQLHEIKHRELPTADDEFAKDVSECDTIQEYRDQLREEVLREKKEKRREVLREKLIEALISRLSGDIPEVMFDKKVKESRIDFEHNLQAQGIAIEDYKRALGLTDEAILEQLRPQAQRQVRLQLALEKVAELEELVPTDDEIEEKYLNFAQIYKLDMDKIKQAISREAMEMDLKFEKAMALLEDLYVK